MDFEMEIDLEFEGDDKSHEVEIEPVIFVWEDSLNLRGLRFILIFPEEVRAKKEKLRILL